MNSDYKEFAEKLPPGGAIFLQRPSLLSVNASVLEGAPPDSFRGIGI
jgi:hypothetical protein